MITCRSEKREIMGNWESRAIPAGELRDQNMIAFLWVSDRIRMRESTKYEWLETGLCQNRSLIFGLPFPNAISFALLGESPWWHEKPFLHRSRNVVCDYELIITMLSGGVSSFNPNKIHWFSKKLSLHFRSVTCICRDLRSRISCSNFYTATINSKMTAMFIICGTKRCEYAITTVFYPSHYHSPATTVILSGE